MVESAVQLTQDLWSKFVLGVSALVDWLVPIIQSAASFLGNIFADVLQALGTSTSGIRQRLGDFGITDDGLRWGLVFVLCFLLLVFVRMRQRRKSLEGANLSEMTRRPRAFGAFAAILLVGVFGIWSVAAPLASAAVALGVVSPDGSRKTVAHLEGGIVEEIHVRDGDAVLAGDALVTMHDVSARARYEELRERYFYLLASHSRLTAQRSEAASIDFVPELIDAPDTNAQQAMENQIELFQSSLATQAGQERILQQRILQLEEQRAGLSEVIAAQERQLALLEVEIADFQSLLDKGLTQAPRVFALKREYARIEAERAGNRARVAETGQRIGETEIQILTMRESELEETNNELADVERQIAEIRSRIQSSEDALKRTIVRASIDGTVMNVRASSEAGVIRPGEALLEIVPRDAALLIDAQVRPTDIDRVQPGMEARVVLSAYSQRNLPQIRGTLRSISADRLVEDRTGQPYYLVKVEVNPDDLNVLDGVELVPGMPAEVMILNDEQTVLEYLLAPIIKSARMSFRES